MNEIKKGRTQRKTKKRLKKLGFYTHGVNWLKCVICQIKDAGYGYDCYYCQDCE